MGSGVNFWLRNHIYQTKLLQFVLFWIKIYLCCPQTFITYTIQNISNVIAKPIWCTRYYLESSYTSASLKPVSATYFRKGHNHSLNCHHQGLFLCYLIYFIVDYFTFIYFISNLLTFINLVLKLYRNTQVLYTI